MFENRKIRLPNLFARIVVFIAMLSVIAHADPMMTTADQTLEVCEGNNREDDSILSAMRELGWIQVQGDEITDRAITAFTAKFAVWHLAGASYGPQWTQVWSRERHMAGGVRRVVSARDVEYRRYFMRYPDDSGFLEVSIRDTPQHAVIHCDLIVTTDSELSFVSPNPEPSRTNVPITRLNVASKKPTTASKFAWYLDADTVSRLIAEPFDARYVISTITRIP